MLQFSEFVWPLSYSVWDFFNNFLLKDATVRSKISSDQKRFFISLSLYLLSFFANTPFKNQFMCNKSLLFRNSYKHEMKRSRDHFSWVKHRMKCVSNLVPKVPFWIWNLKQSTKMAVDIGTVPVRHDLVTLWTCKG